MDKPEDATSTIQTVDDCCPQPRKQPEEFTISLQDWMEAGPSGLQNGSSYPDHLYYSSIDSSLDDAHHEVAANVKEKGDTEIIEKEVGPLSASVAGDQKGGKDSSDEDINVKESYLSIGKEY